MAATVTEHFQVALPVDVCAELGIGPGAQLEFRAKEGKLEAVKVSPSLAEIYTSERNAEELAVQKGCSTEVPEDFPQ
jgi:bifunctional DNA-binding transcriptional regulator/antitoxin component of YhaV-PrlF toxin-antitoxin module